MLCLKPATCLDRAIVGRRSADPSKCIALLLQGAGALGSYQAGVYEALAEAQNKHGHILSHGCVERR